MTTVHPLALGVVLLILGVSLVGLTLAVGRLKRLLPPRSYKPPLPPIPVELPRPSDAVLLVQAGGRILYLNEQGRQWFNLGDERPDLERLARRTRPSEVLLGLCASEGEGRFLLDGRLVEGVSYSVPYDGGHALLVSLHRPQLVVGVESPQPAEGPLSASLQTFALFTEIIQDMAASLDLETTLRSVMEGVERLIPADFVEVNLWDAERRLLIPYRLSGTGDERRLERGSEHPSLSQSYTGYLALQRQPLLIPDVGTFRQVRPAVEHHPPIHSFLGFPLEVGEELIGTLELASTVKENFDENDLGLVRILARQAAVALRNARVHEAEQRRAQELSALANLAQAANTQQDGQDLFTRLVESIAPALDLEVLGFLIYDEGRRALQGKWPFLGLQPTMIEWLQFPIAPHSEAESLWLTQAAIVTEDASNEPRLRAFGLEHLAIAAGIRHLALIPLASGGRALGYLVGGDKRDGTPFNDEDVRLLTLIAAQSAPTIENATLMAQSRRRAQRAETLRRIASLTSSTATPDEMLKFSLQDLARLFQAECAVAFMFDEARGELLPHLFSLFGVSEEWMRHPNRMTVEDADFRRTASGSQQAVLSSDLGNDPTVAPFYHTLAETLKVRSAMVVPLLTQGRCLGEIILGTQASAFFAQGDLQTLSIAAGQLAGAIERARLELQTDESLRRRVEQLTAVARISRELNTTVDLRYLLHRVHDEILRTTRADCGTIMLLDLPPLVVEGQEMEKPRVLLHLGDEPGAELHPLERWVLEHGRSLWVDDFKQPSETLPSALAGASIQPTHTGVQSALVVPIAHQEQVAGLIHLHAKTPQRFDEAAREIAETLAVQAAIALSNALRYQEQVRRNELLNRRVETLARLLEISQTLQLELPLEQALEHIAYAIQTTTPFEVVLFSVYEAETQTLQRVVGAGLSLDEMTELRAHPQPWSSVEKVLRPEFRVGRAYLIPYEKMPLTPPELHTLTVLPFDETTPSDSENKGMLWHPEDMLLIPLMDAHQQPLGLISVDAPRNNLRPDRSTIETLEIFASQAVLVIKSQMELSRLRSQLARVSEDLEQASYSAQIVQERLEFYLHKDLEQVLTIHHLSQSARRIRAGMDIAERCNRQNERGAVLHTLGSEMLARLDLDLVLVVEATPLGPRLLHVLGTPPEGANIGALIGQHNPVHIGFQSPEPLLVARLEPGSEWAEAPLLQALDARAFVCLPLWIEGQGEAVVLGLSTTPLEPFSAEDAHVFALLARQIEVSLQNLRLIEETRQRLSEVNLLLDFNRRLGGLDTVAALDTLGESLQELIPSAQAVMVAWWDTARQSLSPQVALGYRDPQRLKQMTFAAGEALPGRVFASGEGLLLNEVNFARDYNLSGENLLCYRDATDGRLPLSCLAVAIRHREQAQPLGVVVLENFQDTAAFSSQAQALVTSLVQQTALHLENARLVQAAQERANQLQALTGVAATITSNLQPQDLIATLLDLLEAILPYDTGTLWLQQDKKHMLVRAARGFTDSDQRLGLSVALEDSALLSQMSATGLPIAIGDVRSDPRFPSLVEPQYLSWLGVPLLAGGEVIGVIALEKAEADFYTPERIQIAATFAAQAAVALENARLYQESLDRARELDQRSRRLEMLNRLSTALSGSLDQERVLEIAVEEISQAVPCSAALAALFDASGGVHLQAEAPRIAAHLPLILPENPLFERLRQTLGAFNTDDVGREVELAPLADFLAQRQAQSLLVLPLATGNTAHGLLLLTSERRQRFSPEEVDLVRTIANQASIALQNALLFAETRHLSQELEQRVVERTAQLEKAHKRTETLLRIITELSTSLDLEQVLNRTLYLINQIVDAGQITVLVVRPGEKKLYRLASLGYAGQAGVGGKVTPFNADQGLAGWVITTRQAALIDDVLQDARWILLEDTPEPLHRSAMAVPLMVGAEVLGVLLLYHQEAGHFSSDQLDLVQAAANQVAVAINNAELYRLIRDQAEDLGNMFRRQQEEASRSRAILEAVADGVLVTDARMYITLFNASAETILGLERQQVVGRSLEHFIGLFGGAAGAWLETIRTWSEDPSTYQVGEVYEAQITLEDGRVVSVHLSPVSLRDTFLGTVSTFRDITHQVEVDRLKSEFVATVSHELRTPMTSIKGYVELLLMGAAGGMSEQQIQFLQIVKSNTERLATLVNDLLDISRIEAGRASLTLQPLNLEEVAAQALADLRRRAEMENKPMAFELECPSPLPPVLGDLERVRQILDNLLENAYAYTAANGRITLRLQRMDSEVQVDVQDNGIGIPPEVQGRVFERFYRGEHPFVLATSGTGLGLSIVQHLVEMHGGRIWLKSSGVSGEGSVFSFTLPVYSQGAV